MSLFTKPSVELHLTAMPVKNIERLYTWGTTTELEIIAATTLFQLEIYLAMATDSYKPGTPRWLLYSPKLVSLLTSRRVTILSKRNIEDIHASG